MSKKTLNIALTWWGSGGHILPLISLLQMIDETEQYRQVMDKVFRFGEKKGMEYTFFEKYKDTFTNIHPQFISILAGKYRRETIWISRWRNLRDVFLFPLGIIQSIRHILTKKIDVIFCKGWYVSLPVVIAAWICRRQIYVHDSDTTPGLTTRLASRFATQNFSWFPDTLPQTIVVWQILSSGLVAQVSQFPFQIPDDKLLILVAGGSLGAQKLYKAVLKATATDPWFVEHCVIVIVNGQHLIDANDLPKNHDHIIITDLITEQAIMWWLYRRADLAVVRGGTTTLAECKLFDTPLVIVPLPVTHDQQKNAEFYVDNFGDILISQNDPEFVQKLYSSLANITSKHITTSTDKIKEKIAQAKITILDRMLLWR